MSSCHKYVSLLSTSFCACSISKAVMPPGCGQSGRGTSQATMALSASHPSFVLCDVPRCEARYCCAVVTVSCNVLPPPPARRMKLSICCMAVSSGRVSMAVHSPPHDVLYIRKRVRDRALCCLVFVARFTFLYETFSHCAREARESYPTHWRALRPRQSA